MAAIALNTTRLRIGPMVTPLPRRRPWKLARETVTLDHLSGGRLTLGVGSGFPGLIDEDFVAFGEAGEVKRRAALLDEGLDVLAGLWSGKPFSYQGQHYRVAETTFLPGPLQQPRIPVWVPGFWPALGPYRRAARWDGIWPLDPTGQMDPADLIRQAVARVKSLRASPAPFDVIAAGVTPGDDAAAARGVVEPQAAAGATWWCEFLMPARGDLAANRRRIQQGPPGSSRR